MGLSEWLKYTRNFVRKEGITQGIQSGIYEFNLGVIRRAAELSHKPEFIFDHDWDVLIVLDACRLDLMQEVASDYEYIEEIETHTSAATSTTAWCERNFSSQFSNQLSKTSYVTANPNSVTIGNIEIPDTCSCGEPLSHDGRTVTIECSACGSEITGKREHPFAQFDELWRDSWNERLGTLLADTVTARAINHKRTHNPERLIVHYNQPHHPFVIRENGGFENVFHLEEGTNIWHELRKGTVSKERVWSAYRENLGYVLDSLPTFLNNIDANNVIITSDHGNALGEWGIYGHPNPPVPIASLVNVPWIETSAQNTDNKQPEELTNDQTTVGDNVNERLQDLGYL